MSALGDRFWSKVGSAPIDQCWPWLGNTNGEGYGRYNIGQNKIRKAHRLAYEEMVCEIPLGLVLDHLCRNRACVNPWHLEPVTDKVNVNRGVGQQNSAAAKRALTHCSRGHVFDEANTAVRTDGTRRCRTCAAFRARRFRAVAS